MDPDTGGSFLLAGGMIFDGSGGPLFAGDVLVVGNRIEAVLGRANGEMCPRAPFVWSSTAVR